MCVATIRVANSTGHDFGAVHYDLHLPDGSCCWDSNLLNLLNILRALQLRRGVQNAVPSGSSGADEIRASKARKAIAQDMRDDCQARYWKRREKNLSRAPRVFSGRPMMLRRRLRWISGCSRSANQGRSSQLSCSILMRSKECGEKPQSTTSGAETLGGLRPPPGLFTIGDTASCRLLL
jgi:hypothetical protein